MGKRHNLNEIWKDKKGEYLIRTENGTKTYYRYLVEKEIGYELCEGWTIHHLNHNHEDNRLENFMIIPSKLHSWIHRTKNTKDLFVSNISQFKKGGALYKKFIKIDDKINK